jgi:hypothetical protein
MVVLPLVNVKDIVAPVSKGQRRGRGRDGRGPGPTSKITQPRVVTHESSNRRGHDASIV